MWKSEKKQKIAKKLFKDGRVNFIAPADYTENSKIDLIINEFVNGDTEKVIHKYLYEQN